MKYKKYITVAFLALLLVPSINAKKAESPVEDFDLKTIVFIEDNADVELGFDTSEYLPEDFNAYEDKGSIESLNYIENDEIDLGFDTESYLPKGFNPYK